MKTIVILDLDGVLITTPSWRACTILADGFSQFNSEAVEHLNVFLSNINAELWLISDRRKGYSLDDFKGFFANRGIRCELTGLVPNYGNISRREELERFVEDNKLDNFIIIDDDNSLQNSAYKDRWYRTYPLIGLTNEINEVIKTFKNDNKYFQNNPLKS